jgi:hypothetical protein
MQCRCNLTINDRAAAVVAFATARPNGGPDPAPSTCCGVSARPHAQPSSDRLGDRVWSSYRIFSPPPPLARAATPASEDRQEQKRVWLISFALSENQLYSRSHPRESVRIHLVSCAPLLAIPLSPCAPSAARSSLIFYHLLLSRAQIT